MSNKNKIVRDTIILLIVFIIGIIGYFLYNRGYFDNKLTINKEVVDDSNINKDVKNYLDRFITVASYYSDKGYSTTADLFYNGTNSIDRITKLKMTYNSVYNIDKKVKTDKTLSSKEFDSMTKYNNLDPSSYYDIIQISDFTDAYSELFFEKLSFSLDEIRNIGCPRPIGYNKDLDRIYLLNDCIADSYGDVSFIIKSYNYDNNYYYVHQDVDIKTSVEESDIITFKVLWKFSKDLKFISTSRE